MEKEVDAETIITQLKEMSDEKAKKANQRTFRWSNDTKTSILGVKMGQIFKLAKEHSSLSLDEVKLLLESDYYEARVVAVSILDFKARKKSLSKADRKELYDMYVENHHRINNWGMVDRAAPYVVGGYLYEAGEGYDALIDMAQSDDIWQRRTAMVATAYFIKQGDTEPTFQVAEILKFDDHELINKAVGSWIREAGKKNEDKLRDFLDKYYQNLPRVTLRYAVEKLDEKSQELYLSPT